MLETLDYIIRIVSTPTIIYFDFYLYFACAVHYVCIHIHIYIYIYIQSRSYRGKREGGGGAATAGPLSVVCRNILMPVGKSDGRRRRIDPERLTHSCYCILQIITFYFRFLQETE